MWEGDRMVDHIMMIWWWISPVLLCITNEPCLGGGTREVALAKETNCFLAPGKGQSYKFTRISSSLRPFLWKEKTSPAVNYKDFCSWTETVIKFLRELQWAEVENVYQMFRFVQTQVCPTWHSLYKITVAEHQGTSKHTLLFPRSIFLSFSYFPGLHLWLFSLLFPKPDVIYLVSSPYCISLPSTCTMSLLFIHLHGYFLNLPTTEFDIPLILDQKSI